jgi:uncharacterized protein with PQ loop repeat
MQKCTCKEGNEVFYEAIGLMATLFVLASFLVNDIKLVRTINIAGAALFVAYGLLIGAFSTWLLNAILIFVHFYHLIKMGDY